MPDNAPPRPSIMSLIAGYVPARLIYLTAELGIADLIARGTTTVEGLSERTNMHAPSLKRMLRALCAYDVFEENKLGEFALRPMGEQLRTDVPGSLCNFARFYPDQRSWRSFEEIEHTVRTGKTAMSLVFGMDSSNGSLNIRKRQLSSTPLWQISRIWSHDPQLARTIFRRSGLSWTWAEVMGRF